MQFIKNNITTTIIAVLVIAFLVVFFKSGINIGTTSSVPQYMAVSTSGAMTIGTNDSVRLLSTTTARKYALITNNSASSVYLNLNGDKAAEANKNILLTASSTYEISEQNLYIGSVQAIGTNTAASTTVLVTEFAY